MSLSIRVAKMIRSATLMKNTEKRTGELRGRETPREVTTSRPIDHRGPAAPKFCPYCDGKGWRLVVGSGIEGWEPCDDCGATGEHKPQRGISE